MTARSSYMLTGILGGTFNPVHHGHLRLAQELAERIGMHEVRFIPSAQPPHKGLPDVSAEDRAMMVRLAIANNPLFTLDTLELERHGPSYTIDTLTSLHATLPDRALCLIMGSDAFLALNTWHRWEALTDYAHIILVERPNHDHGELHPALQAFLQSRYTDQLNDLHTQRSGKITMIEIPALAISSSQIRALIKQRRSPAYLCHESTVAYIQDHLLYR